MLAGSRSCAMPALKRSPPSLAMLRFVLTCLGLCGSFFYGNTGDGIMIKHIGGAAAALFALGACSNAPVYGPTTQTVGSDLSGITITDNGDGT